MGALHPPLVHFAIALTITGTIFEVLGFVLKKESLKHAGFWSFIVGVIFVWGAMLSGHEAGESVENFLPINAKEILEVHEELGEILPYIFTILGGLRIYLWFKENKKLYYLFLIGAFISTIFVGYQGKLGGNIVYDYLVKINKNTSNIEDKD